MHYTVHNMRVNPTVITACHNRLRAYMQDQPVGPLDPEELRKINAYWRAANYLSVGQIYLLENPLLRTPLRKEQIKPRLLGHWGTTPGLNFIYAHVSRVIRQPIRTPSTSAVPAMADPAWWPILISKAPVPNYIRTFRGMKRVCSAFSNSSRFPAASPATPRRRRPAQSMKAANSATRCCMPTAPCSIIQSRRLLRSRRWRGRNRTLRHQLAIGTNKQDTVQGYTIMKNFCGRVRRHLRRWLRLRRHLPSAQSAAAF